MRYGTALAVGLLLAVWPAAHAEEKPKPDEHAKAVAAAREKGLDWLTKHQAANGSWGKQHSIAVTSFACLSYLSATDEPFVGDRGKALLKGLQFLLAQQKDGTFPQQGHTWIHGQGFAALALSEAYGRALLCKTKPDLDTKKLRAAVAGAVKAIGDNQSTSGGWWYTRGQKSNHEGSTTVCAVQALASADNYKIPIDKKVLDRGFAYLKECQNKDGGFDYRLGDAVSMKAGTAGAVATLGLMKKFDYTVMIKGYQFLLKVTPDGIGKEQFPYYGHFYGSMGMHLLWQEYKVDKTFRTNTEKYLAGVQKGLLAWQAEDGSWPLRGWIKSSGGEDAAYGTAYATMTLFVTDARLSIYNRTPPKLPRGAGKE
jgi:hypothetical protein